VQRKRTFRSTVVATVGAMSIGLVPSPAQTTEQYETFVVRSYGDLLNRSPESPAFESWVGALQAGLPRTDYALSILHSREFQEVTVGSFYSSYLHRSADPSGLAAYSPLIDGGSTWERVQSLILGSDEFFANVGSANTSFIDALYGIALERSPDPDGNGFFLQRLGEGWSRQMVAEAVVLSPEARARFIADIYAFLLGRAVDPPSLEVWVVTPYEAVVGAIAASDEYFNLPPGG
jgi:hypothetical protein